MNILLGSFREFSKIPAFRKQIRTLKMKDPSHALSLEHTHTFVSQACIFAFFLFDSKGPHRACNQGSSRQQQLVQANLMNLSPRAVPWPLLLIY